MIGHTGGEGENGLQLSHVGAGAMHQQRRSGAAGAEQFYGVVHVSSELFSEESPKKVTL
jgi:hypothetical protein